MGVTMSFDGWPLEAIAFYTGLEADNSKAYWTAHKAVFEAAVRAPMEALVADLEPSYGAARIMRPYRDVRFSADKSPYRTALGAMLGDAYVQISARGLGVGSGYYHLMADQLDRYRAAVDADESGAELAHAVAGIRSAGVDVSGTEPLKTAPRGYPADHPRIELLRYKGIVAWRQWPVEPWLSTPAARDRVVEVLEIAAPLRAWLATQVGPTTEPPRRRR
jgi:uncharacterized protein (TIGR02453 family)